MEKKGRRCFSLFKKRKDFTDRGKGYIKHCKFLQSGGKAKTNHVGKDIFTGKYLCKTGGILGRSFAQEERKEPAGKLVRFLALERLQTIVECAKPDSLFHIVEIGITAYHNKFRVDVPAAAFRNNVDTG